MKVPAFHAKYERLATATVSMKSPAWALVDMESAVGRPPEIWEAAEGLGDIGVLEAFGNMGEELGLGIAAGSLMGIYISPELWLEGWDISLFVADAENIVDGMHAFGLAWSEFRHAVQTHDHVSDQLAIMQAGDKTYQSSSERSM